jgi:hypothetical protein
MRFWKKPKKVARFDLPIEQRLDIEDDELLAMMTDPEFTLEENFQRLGLAPIPKSFRTGN